MAPAVEGGPLELECKDVTISPQTNEFLGNEVIREEEGNVDMEGEGEGVNPTPTSLPSSEAKMRDPSLEELPSSPEDEIEMEEIRRNKRERDEADRGRRKRRREEDHRGYKRKGGEPERRQPEWEGEGLEVWDQDGTVQNEKYSRIGQLTTGDKEEGKGRKGKGLCRSKPPVIQEVISPSPRNLENVEIVYMILRTRKFPAQNRRTIL